MIDRFGAPGLIQFDTISVSDHQPFLEPWGAFVRIRDRESLSDYYEFSFGWTVDHIRNRIIPKKLEERISNELGLVSRSNIDHGVADFFVKDVPMASELNGVKDSYVVKFFGPESYLLFKMAYYGSCF